MGDALAGRKEQQMSDTAFPIVQELTEQERQDLETTLSLEFGANRRYEYQIGIIQNPRVNAMLEGIKRNEADHADTSFAALRRARSASVPGFATILQMLETDLRFEEEAIKSYAAFAAQASDPEIRAYYQELTRSEGGHKAVLLAAIKTIKAGEYPVVFYCPKCGWEIAFGVNPSVGQRLNCPKCGFPAELGLEDGDWRIVKAVK